MVREIQTTGSTIARGNVVKVEDEAPVLRRMPPENCNSLHARNAHLSPDCP